VTCAIVIFWYGGYVLYAFIGFGLWRLRRWAWKAVFILQLVTVGFGLIAAVCCHRDPFMAAAIAVLSLSFTGVILWYLNQPNVRAAFGVDDWVIHLPRFADSTGTRLPKMKTWMKITIVAVVCLALFTGFLFFGINEIFRKSDVYVATLNEAQKSPCVIARLGQPVVAKGMISGSIETSEMTGSADLEIPIRGPKAKGNLSVSAKKSDSSWTINSLTLEVEGTSLQLIPAASAPCQ
jgi:hypothetical protein